MESEVISVSAGSELLTREMLPNSPLLIEVFKSFKIEISYFNEYSEKQIYAFSSIPFCAYNIINDEYISLCSEKSCLLIKLSNNQEISKILGAISAQHLVASTDNDLDYFSGSITSPEAEESFYILLSYFISMFPPSEPETFSISSFLELASASLMTYFLHRYHFRSNQFVDSQFFQYTSEPKEFSMDNIIILRTLGTGRHGEVSLVFDSTCGDILVLKSFKEISKFEKEKELYSRCDYQLLVKYCGYIEGEGILMEYMNNGSLADHLNDPVLTPMAKSKIIFQILLAIDYLHSKGIRHSGIDANHVLFDHDMNVFLSDFDLAEEMNCKFDYDLYSLALLIYELATGKKGFENLSLQESISELMKRNIPRLSDDFYTMQEFYYILTQSSSFWRPSTFNLFDGIFCFPGTNLEEFTLFHKNALKGHKVLNTDRVDYQEILVKAQEGDSESLYRLSRIYSEGLLCEKNQELVYKYCLQAAESGYAMAQYFLSSLLHDDNPDEAFKWSLKSAEQGLSNAQVYVGSCYCTGTSVPQDYNKALEWFMKAAKQGNADGQLQVGKIFIKGSCGKKDHPKAIQWILKSAYKGNAEAHYCIGRYFCKGICVKKNLSKAFERFMRAALRNYAQAQYNVGNFYLKGKGVKKDISKAIEWLKKAEEQEYVQAAASLGLIYRSCVLGRQDHEKSVYYLQKAFQKVNSTIDTVFAKHLIKGVYVKQDIVKAMEVLTKLANFGCISALIAIANIYESGKYVPRDLNRAYMILENFNSENTNYSRYSLASFMMYNGKEQQGLELMHQFDAYGRSEYKFSLAHILLKKGIEIKKAVSLLSEIAEKGYPSSQLELALLYKEGKYVQLNIGKARKLIKKAADDGNSEACYELGNILEKEGNIQGAIKMYKRACTFPKQEYVSKLKEFVPNYKITFPTRCSEERKQFLCFTCCLFTPNCICPFCALNCHKGHDIVEVMMENYECDCGIRGSDCTS